MDPMKIRCFMVLARTLNFTKAAEKLYLTQQAVSRSIAGLEQELQLQLFERNTRSVRMTAEGQELYAFFRKNDAEYRQLLEDLRKKQHPFTVRIGYQNYISFYEKLRHAQNSLIAEFPDMKMDVERYSPPVLRKKLRQHELDLIIIYGRFFNEHKGCNVLPLCKIQQYFMVADDKPLPESDPLSALRSETFIIDKVENETPAEQKARIKMERERWGLTGGTLLVPDRDSAYTQAEMGKGVIVGTDISIMASGRALKRINCGFTEELCAVWRENETNPLIARYTEALRDAFEPKQN